MYNCARATQWPSKWDPKKAGTNLRKHGVRFADAVSVLQNERAITVPEQSSDEERWITLGIDSMGRILVVVCTWRGERIRIIFGATGHRSRTPSI